MSGYYPPGVSSLPWDSPNNICDVCGKQADSCCCPECEHCGEHGKPECYDGGSPHFHYLVRNAEQIASRKEFEKRQQIEADMDKLMEDADEKIAYKDMCENYYKRWE